MAFLVLKFLFFSSVVCIAGICVTKSTVSLSKEFGFSDIFGGVVVLAIVTNLPEIAIIWAAARRNELDLAVGNILGGIALQTVVICIFDAFRMERKRSFDQETSSKQVIVEGLLVIFILTLVIMGYFLPSTLVFARIPLPEGIIVVSWLTGLLIIHREKNVKFTAKRRRSKKFKILELIIFIASSIGTWWGGYYLEEVSSKLALELGINGIVFGATILAFVTALPEISTGLAAIFLKHNRLAVSDIFGGNAFLPCLFLPAAVYVGHPIIAIAKNENIYLTALGILLTVIFSAGMTIKSKSQLLIIGSDTLAVLCFYGLGIAGLLMIKVV